MSEKALPEPLLVRCPKDKIVKKADNCLKCKFFDKMEGYNVYCTYVSDKTMKLYEMELELQESAT